MLTTLNGPECLFVWLVNFLDQFLSPVSCDFISLKSTPICFFAVVEGGKVGGPEGARRRWPDLPCHSGGLYCGGIKGVDYEDFARDGYRRRRPGGSGRGPCPKVHQQYTYVLLRYLRYWSIRCLTQLTAVSLIGAPI